MKKPISNTAHIELVSSALNSIPLESIGFAALDRITRIVAAIQNPDELIRYGLLEQWVIKASEKESNQANVKQSKRLRLSYIKKHLSPCHTSNHFPHGWITEYSLFEEAIKHGRQPPDDIQLLPTANLVHSIKLEDQDELYESSQELSPDKAHDAICGTIKRGKLNQHPYLTDLNLTPNDEALEFVGRCGLLFQKKADSLVIPFGNGVKWVGAQAIHPRLRSECLNRSAITSEPCWHPIGTPRQNPHIGPSEPDGEVIFIATDFIQGVVLFKASQRPIAVVRGSSQIGAVAARMRMNFPNRKIIICPNQQTDNLSASLPEIARKINASVLAPPDHGTTFYEIFKTHGLDHVSEILRDTMHSTAQDRGVQHG